MGHRPRDPVREAKEFKQFALKQFALILSFCVVFGGAYAILADGYDHMKPEASAMRCLTTVPSEILAGKELAFADPNTPVLLSVDELTRLVAKAMAAGAGEDIKTSADVTRWNQEALKFVRSYK